jgi:uncharacterized membrane protein YbhN (UPF0104 family)
MLAGLLLGLGVADGPHDLVHAWVPVAGAIAVVAVVLVLPLPARLRPVVDGIASARRTLARPSRPLAAAAGYLVFDIAVLWATLAAMGEPPPAVALAAGYIVGYLGSTVPIPGGVGVLDASLACTLIAYGTDPALAAAAVLVYHAIAFWVPSLGGAAALASLRESARQYPAAVAR